MAPLLVACGQSGGSAGATTKPRPTATAPRAVADVCSALPKKATIACGGIRNVERATARGQLPAGTRSSSSGANRQRGDWALSGVVDYEGGSYQLAVRRASSDRVTAHLFRDGRNILNWQSLEATQQRYVPRTQDRVGAALRVIRVMPLLAVLAMTGAIARGADEDARRLVLVVPAGALTFAVTWLVAKVMRWRLESIDRTARGASVRAWMTAIVSVVATVAAVLVLALWIGRIGTGTGL